MLTNLNQTDVEMLDEAKKLLKRLVTALSIVWLFVLIVPRILAIEAFRKLPAVSLFSDALPVGLISPGTTFFILLVIVATGVGAYGYGARSWTLVSFGFSILVFHLSVFLIAGCWYLVSGLWHLLAIGIFALREWGFKEQTRNHTVETLFTVVALGITFILLRVALKALKTSFQGVLVIGRAQEIESPFMETLSSMEGKSRDEVMLILLKNSLARCMAISFVGHFIAINVFSIPQAINAVAESIAAASESRQEQQAQQQTEGAKPVKPAESGKEKGKGAPEGKGTEKGKDEKPDVKKTEGGEEPEVKFNTPGATEKTPSEKGKGDEPEAGVDEAQPSNDARDYDKHKGKSKEGKVDEDDFGGLDSSDGEDLIKKGN